MYLRNSHETEFREIWYWRLFLKKLFIYSKFGYKRTFQEDLSVFRIVGSEVGKATMQRTHGCVLVTTVLIYLYNKIQQDALFLNLILIYDIYNI